MTVDELPVVGILAGSVFTDTVLVGPPAPATVVELAATVVLEPASVVEGLTVVVVLDDVVVAASVVVVVEATVVVVVVGGGVAAGAHVSPSGSVVLVVNVMVLAQ
ncbi:MAG: hypothetical protein WCO88_08380 [Actinomycetota bacterium]